MSIQTQTLTSENLSSTVKALNCICSLQQVMNFTHVLSFVCLWGYRGNSPALL